MILKDLPQKGNVITYSAAISACEKGSQWLKPASSKKSTSEAETYWNPPKKKVEILLQNAKRVWSLEGVTKKNHWDISCG